MLALIGVDDEETTSLEPDEILTAAQQATEMLDDIELTIQNAALSKLSESLPTAIKILQTPDQYAISTDHYMLQSPGFASDSGHLQNSTALFERFASIFCFQFEIDDLITIISQGSRCNGSLLPWPESTILACS